MRRYLLLCTVAAMLLSACGNIDAGSTDNDGDDAAKESVSDTSEAGDDSEKNVDSDDVKAAASSVNMLGDKLSGKIGDAYELYSMVMQAMENAEAVEEADDPKTVKIGFEVGDDEYVLSLCADNVFAWTEHDAGEVTYFKPDDETAQQLRDMMLAHSALGYILEGAAYTIDTGHSESSFISDIADEIPATYCESQYYYNDDRNATIFLIQNDGDEMFCMQETDERTDMIIGDSPYYMEQEFYEYFTDGKGKEFYRPEAYDVYYIAEEYEGDFQPVPLAKGIAGEEQYLYTFAVSTDDSEMSVEVWQGDADIDYVLIENGEIKAMWSLAVNGGSYEGVTLMYDFMINDVYSGEIDEIIEHAEQHMSEDEQGAETVPSDADEQLEDDTEEDGLFDLSDIEVGDEVAPTGVVEEWRRYMSSGKEPFTYEFRGVGSEGTMYELATFENGNFYFCIEMEQYDTDSAIGSEQWLIDGYMVESVYELADHDSRKSYELEPSSNTRVPLDLLFEDDQRGDSLAGKCERAYEVKISGEKYICEEWSLMGDRLWKVYIKDGNIVAWEGDLFCGTLDETVLRLEKTADSELLKIPQNVYDHVSND